MYLTIAISLYFYITSLSLDDLLKFQQLSDNYFLKGGVRTNFSLEYSKALNTTLLILTFIAITALLKFRHFRRHPRTTNTPKHYFFVLLFLPTSSYFLWIYEWTLFSNQNVSVVKDITIYTFVTCSLNAWFISEFWYFIDMVQKLYQHIRSKISTQNL